MKRLIALLIVLAGYCVPAWAIDAPVRLQSSGAFAADAVTPHTTFDTNTITIGAGHWVRAIMFACTQFACSGSAAIAQPASIVGTAGNTYFQCGLTTGSTQYQAGAWFAYFPSGSSEKVTFSNYGGGSNNLYGNYGLIEEFTGIDPSATCNSEGRQMSSSTTAISLTTDGSVPSGYVVFGACYSDDYITWDSPSVGIGSPTAQAYKLTVGSGTVTMTGTAGSAGIAYCVQSALLGVTSGGGGATSAGMLMTGVN